MTQDSALRTQHLLSVLLCLTLAPICFALPSDNSSSESQHPLSVKQQIIRDRMMRLAARGIRELHAVQAKALRRRLKAALAAKT